GGYSALSSKPEVAGSTEVTRASAPKYQTLPDPESTPLPALLKTNLPESETSLLPDHNTSPLPHPSSTPISDMEIIPPPKYKPLPQGKPLPKNQPLTCGKPEIGPEKQTDFSVFISNIPFECQYPEVRKIFEKYGGLIQLSLPRGARGHRGYGFAKYENKLCRDEALKLHGYEASGPKGENPRRLRVTPVIPGAAPDKTKYKNNNGSHHPESYQEDVRTTNTAGAR
ncbi:hypothetical protein OTU49_003061, partial [Cherax quadricarinatus]